VDQPAVSDGNKAIERLCRAMYERANERDFDSIYQVMAIPCKEVLTAAELGSEFTSGGRLYRDGLHFEARSGRGGW
jgi:hypothetical protein